MGMDTLVNGLSHKNGNGHRRGDLALIVAAILAGFKLYESLAGQPAIAADDMRTARLEQAFNDFKVSVTSRLAVLESKARK